MDDNSMTFFEDKPKVLLLGVGYTLSRVAKLLGPELTLLGSRNEKSLEDLVAQGFVGERVDITNKCSLEDLLTKYPTLSVIVDGTPPAAESEKPELGAQNVVEILPSSGIQRVIYLSTTGVYGVQDGSWVDEENPLAPFYQSAVNRVKVEQVYRSAAVRYGFTLSVLRISGIYGPERGVLARLQRGEFNVSPEMASKWSNRIHVSDLSNTIRKAIECPVKELPSVLCLSDDLPSPLGEVLNYYRQRYGKQYPEILFQAEEKSRESPRLQLNQRVSNKKLREFLKAPLEFPTYKDI